LPGNFAEDILYLEMELDQEDVPIATISRLLELYSAGVEYFESINSNRYVVFKTKTM
jgi:hypothetical protein